MQTTGFKIAAIAGTFVRAIETGDFELTRLRRFDPPFRDFCGAN
jgi:hypothetical protein